VDGVYNGGVRAYPRGWQGRRQEVGEVTGPKGVRGPMELIG